jgi:hypothetical protein
VRGRRGEGVTRWLRPLWELNCLCKDVLGPAWAEATAERREEPF